MPWLAPSPPSFFPRKRLASRFPRIFTTRSRVTTESRSPSCPGPVGPRASCASRRRRTTSRATMKSWRGPFRPSSGSVEAIVTPFVRPVPIRTDASNRFAHFSMSVRVPKILEEVVERNPDYPREIQQATRALADSIRRSESLPPLGFPAPDEDEWSDIGPRTWLATNWFFAECFVYRCLVAAVRYWETGRDPFAPTKRAELAGPGLWTALDAALDRANEAPHDRVAALLGLALWGNRVDLSYAVGTAFGAHGQSEDLLVDDRVFVADKLLAKGGDVHIVADNTGSELS